MKAHALSDGAATVGVVVAFRASEAGEEEAMRAAAVEAIAKNGDSYGERMSHDGAAMSFEAMTHREVGAFRWVPCDPDGDVCRYLWPCEPGEPGSFFAVHWSFPW